MDSWFASLFITYLLCAVMMTAAGQNGTSDFESEYGIPMKLESLESRIQEQEVSLRDQQISNLEQDALITELTSDMADKDNRISDLEAGMADINNRISDLEAGMTDKDNRISDLEAGMTDTDNRISDLEAGMTNTDNRISDLDTRLTEKESHIYELQTALSEQEAEIANLTLRLTESVHAVGFTARSPEEIQTVPGQMAFKTVLTNEDGAFNASTGVFTCPMAGVYYFSVALVKAYNHNGGAACSIYKNDGFLVQALNQPGHNTGLGQYDAVNGVYTRLAVNHTVTLRYCATPIETVFVSSSTFTGFLVTPDD